jgi:hypothetical protein
LWVLAQDVHDDRNSDDGLGLESVLAQKNDHVDVETGYVSVFAQNVAYVIGHVPDEIVVLTLNDRLKRSSHHHVHSFLELLHILLCCLDQVREGEQFFQLV